MTLSDKDRHTIELLYKEKGWGARMICDEMPNRGWVVSSVHRVIDKVRETGSSDRRPGSGRPATAMTEEHKAFVMKRAMSDKEQPGTSLSTRQMGAELGISNTSVRNIKKALNIRTFTRIRTPRLTPGARQRRGERAEFLRASLTEADVPMLVFYDEKDITLERPLNRQTDKVCGVGRKRDVSPERLFHETSRFSKKLMVCGAVSARGKSTLIVVDPQRVKIDAAEYQRVLKKILPSVRRLYPEGEEFIWVQDSAPSHRANSTQAFLTEAVPAFVPSDAWPPNSPDANPLDYHVWGELRERLYRGRTEAFGSLQELEAAVKLAWREIPQANITKAIDRFLGRIDLIAGAEGGPIQHLAR